MEAPVGFEVVGTRGYYRPQGEVTLEQAIALLTAATVYAHSLGLSELLLSATAFTGYDQPSLLDRYDYGASLANLGGTLRVAQVVPAHIIDPQHFGALVATNRDLETSVFTSEAAAEAWLDDKSASEGR